MGLDSIDAPEVNQPGGLEAKAALVSRVEGKQVYVDVVTQDRYERLVAAVFWGNENVNEWMVKQGDAWAYRQYVKDRNYCVWEDEARSLRRGLWAGDQWIAPWEWRKWQGNRQAVTHDYSDETVSACIRALVK